MRLCAVWPSINPKRSNETARLWIGQGYQVAIMTNGYMPVKAFLATVTGTAAEYKGYYQSVIVLAHMAIKEGRADVIIFAGDRISPPMHARAWQLGATFAAKFPNGYGVMQPMAAQWKPTISGLSAREEMSAPNRRMHATPPSAERCESPWIGRRFVTEVYNGNGPYCSDYGQYFGDVELYEVARRMGVLWQRTDVVQEFDHWSKPGGPSMEDYQQANFDRWYEKDLATYRARRYKEFPGSGTGGSVKADLITPSKKLILPGD